MCSLWDWRALLPQLWVTTGRINSGSLSLEAQRFHPVPVRGSFLLPVHRVRQRRVRQGRQAAGLAESRLLLRVRMLLGAPCGHSPVKPIPAAPGQRGPALRAAPVLQDGRVPRAAQPDADHALRQRHRLRHRRALRPVGPREEVREIQCWWRAGMGEMELQASICLPKALLSSAGV